MTYDRAIENRYQYFRSGGRRDQAFLENILLPGLARGSRLAGSGAGIELPHGVGEEPEYLPYKDAADLAIDWFVEHKNIESSDVATLDGLVYKKNYRQISEILNNVLRSRVQDPQKLLKSRLVQNVAELQEIKDLEKKEQDSRFAYHPASDLRDFARLQREVTRLATLGIPQNLISSFIPKELTALDPNITNSRFIEIITSNPQFLKIYDLHASNPAQAANKITQEYVRLISSQYPDFDSTLNFAGTEEFSGGLYSSISHLKNELEKSKFNIDKYSELQLSASHALPHLLPHQSELLSRLASLNTFSSDADKNIFARTLMNTMVASSAKQLSAEEIINLTAKNIGLSPSQLALVKSAFTTELLSTIEYQQNELHFGLENVELTRSEVQLLKRGINPFHTGSTLEDIVTEAQQILSDESLKEEDARPRIERLYQKEKSSENPNNVELFRLRSWLDRHDTTKYLNAKGNESLKKLSDNTKLERLVEKYSNRWQKFEEKLPWNVGIKKYFEWYDEQAKKWIIKLKLPNGKSLEIPILKFNTWLFETWQGFKETQTLGAITRLSAQNWGRFEWARKYTLFTLKEYQLGGHTTGGMVYHLGHKAWGKFAYWATRGVVKNGALFAARTATRFLLKVGGKTLAKAGVKAITSIALAASTIGAVVSVITLLSLAFDLVKLVFSFIRNFIKDKDFRKSVLNVMGVFAAIGATLASLPVMVVAGIFAAFLLQLALLALLWAGGLTVGLYLLYQIFQTTITLDSNTTSIASVVCDASGSSTSNSTTNTALCIYKALSECKVNPLTLSGTKDGKWQCVVNALASFPGASDQLEKSAAVHNGGDTSPQNLQCVGLAAASSDPSFPQVNACTYATMKVAGYQYLDGCPNMQPGDLFIMGANDCWNEKTNDDGTVGHIGVVVDPSGGQKFTCVDANYSFGGNGIKPGEVRSPTGPKNCFFAKTLISGCLRKK